MITIATLQTLAVEFLNIADELNEKVSAYIDGSDEKEDIAAYDAVKSASISFGKAYCEYYDEPFDHRLRDGFNYEIAESVIA